MATSTIIILINQFWFLPRSSSTASSLDHLSTKPGPNPDTPHQQEWDYASTIYISSPVVNSLLDNTKCKRLLSPPTTFWLKCPQDKEVVDNQLARASCSKSHFIS
jgi:hypothetical protein